MKLSISPCILDHNFLLLLVPNPTMSTIDNFGPIDTWPFSHCNYRNPYCSTIKYHNKLLLKITQINRLKSDRYGYSHTWGNITTLLLGICDIINVELLFTQRGYFYSLDMHRLINQFNFTFINSVKFEMVKNYALRYTSKLWPS